MGVAIDKTPKCHAKLAGKGIEYTWCFGKNHYRRQPLNLKQNTDAFRELVTICLSRQ